MVKKNHSSHKVYIVQDILDTKINAGCQFYKVKWKGYSYAECTWEPQESFNCSIDILNQFLQARAKKQPSFKEKLRKVQKERSLIHQHQNKIIEKTKSIKKPDKKIKSENLSESSNLPKYSHKDHFQSQILPKTSHLKYPEDEDQSNSEEEPHQYSNKKQQSESSRIRSEHEQLYENAPKSNHFQKQLAKSKQTGMNPDITNEKMPTSTKPTLKPSILPKKEELQIIKVEKEGDGLRFYVKKNDKKMWKSKQEMHQNYLRELCEYYEMHLSFDS